MAGIPSDHAGDVREALRSVASDPDLGPSTLSDAAAMSNLLKDLLPDAPREKNLLVAAAEARLAEMMLDHAGQGIDARSAVRLAAASFGSNTLYSPEVCLWVARELAIALGIAPELTAERTELPAEEPRAPAVAAPAPVAAAVTEAPVAEASAAEAPVADATVSEPPVAEPAVSEPPVAEPLVAEPVVVQGGPLPAGANAGAVPRRPFRRVGIGPLLVLAGLGLAIVGYALPVFNDPYYYGNERVLGLTRHIGQGGLVSLIGAALSAAAMLFVPRRRGQWLAAASGIAVASGLLMAAVFWHIYSEYVGSGDQIRPGLVAGLLGAALLAIGGAVSIVGYVARRTRRADDKISQGQS